MHREREIVKQAEGERGTEKRRLLEAIRAKHRKVEEEVSVGEERESRGDH